MRYWDSSALVPLIVAEPASERARTLLKQDPGILTWWGSEVECASAVARLERDRKLPTDQAAQACGLLHTLSQSWHEIQPQPPLRETALRFLRVHPLRAADVLQLAAAFMAAGQRPSTLEFVCLDDRLAAAAEREGFRVVG